MWKIKMFICQRCSLNYFKRKNTVTTAGLFCVLVTVLCVAYFQVRILDCTGLYNSPFQWEGFGPERGLY